MSLPPPQVKDIVRIMHFEEKNRNVTIAYRLLSSNNVKYAASIFQKEKGHVWNKKQNVHTASRRLEIRPLFTEYVINFGVDKQQNKKKGDEFRKFLRDKIHKLGVGSKRTTTTPTTLHKGVETTVPIQRTTTNSIDTPKKKAKRTSKIDKMKGMFSFKVHGSEAGKKHNVVKVY